MTTATVESSSRPADRASAVTAALLASAIFLLTWSLLHHGFYASDQLVDTPIYQGYGDRMGDGQMPYRDFRLEYPPASLPVFALPALGHEGDFDSFRATFEALMAICGLAALGFLAVALVALEADARRLGGVLAFTALAPLALGSLVLSRFDLWPSALTMAGLAALLARRERVGLGVLGLAAAAKIFPVVLIPPALVYVWRARGRREALLGAAAFSAGVLACFLPFVLLSAHGLWASLARQADRPLQIESLGSAALLAAHHVFGLAVKMRTSSGSQNLAGSLPDAVAAVQAALQALVVGGLWVAFARGPATRERLVRYSAAVLVAFVAFNKVLSPQFLIWLVPLVPLVRGRRGVTASALLAVVLVLTQVWFPYRYGLLAFHFDPVASWLVLVRDLGLLALLLALAWPTRPPRVPAHS